MDSIFLDERLVAQEYREQEAFSALPSGPITGAVSLNPGSINAQTRGSVNFTLTGAMPGDIVIMEPPSALNAGLVYAGAEVAAASTVTVHIGNLTGGAIDDGANTWRFLWFDLT